MRVMGITNIFVILIVNSLRASYLDLIVSIKQTQFARQRLSIFLLSNVPLNYPKTITIELFLSLLVFFLLLISVCCFSLFVYCFNQRYIVIKSTEDFTKLGQNACVLSSTPGAKSGCNGEAPEDKRGKIRRFYEKHKKLILSISIICFSIIVFLVIR
jgi:hypothetical protein